MNDINTAKLGTESEGNAVLPLVISRLSFHVHNDIEDGAKWFKIPLVFWNKESVYVMQEDRCVFVSNASAAL